MDYEKIFEKVASVDPMKAFEYGQKLGLHAYPQPEELLIEGMLIQSQILVDASAKGQDIFADMEKMYGLKPKEGLQVLLNWFSRAKATLELIEEGYTPKFLTDWQEEGKGAVSGLEELQPEESRKDWIAHMKEISRNYADFLKEDDVLQEIAKQKERLKSL